MTDKEINIAIAEACGWELRDTYFSDTDVRKWWHLRGTLDYHPTSTPPDYCNDLNACHDMEKFIARDKIKKYTSTLIGLHAAAWNATARQRCEAFLRTIGKWKEGEKK